MKSKISILNFKAILLVLTLSSATASGKEGDVIRQVPTFSKKAVCGDLLMREEPLPLRPKDKSFETLTKTRMTRTLVIAEVAISARLVFLAHGEGLIFEFVGMDNFVNAAIRLQADGTLNTLAQGTNPHIDGKQISSDRAVGMINSAFDYAQTDLNSALLRTLKSLMAEVPDSFKKLGPWEQVTPVKFELETSLTN